MRRVGRGARRGLELPRGSPLRRRLLRLYAALLGRFGPQSRWPDRPAILHALPAGRLAALVRMSGFHRVEAERLLAILTRLAGRHGGSLRRVLRQPISALRAELLAIRGVGPETADAIILVAAGRPVFVVDADTRRVLSRHRLVPPGTGYESLQAVFMGHLPHDPALFNEYHALLVRVAQEYCRASVARCAECPLRFDLRGRPPRL